MKSAIAVLLFAVPAHGASFADASLGAAELVRAASSFVPRLASAAASAQPRNPRRRGIASISGRANHSEFRISINKAEGRITGAANGGEIDLAMDFDGQTISGGANNGEVRLRFDWDNGTLSGGANGPVETRYDASTARIEGGIRGARISLGYDRSSGRIAGAAGGSACELSYDELSGRLSGGCNGSPMELTLDNLTIDELFDTYAFLVFTRR